MPEMSLAFAAGDFGPAHVMTEIFVFVDDFLLDWRREARPATAGIEFTGGGKQWFAATDAAIGAVFVAIPVFPGKGTLGTLFTCDMKLKFGELGTPFGQRFVDDRRGFFFSHGAHYNRNDVP